MRPTRYISRVCINQPKDAVCSWHLQRGSFARSFPCWENITFIREEELPGRQRRIFAFFKKGFFKIQHIFRSQSLNGDIFLQTLLEKGPFKYLSHQLKVHHHGTDSCELIEIIEYTLLFPFFFSEFRKKRFTRRLKRYFEYKHDVLVKDLVFFEQMVKGKDLKILVSGSTGLIGSSLVNFLKIAGHDVWTLVRSKSDLDEEKSILFDLRTGEAERSKLEGFDAVVHLWGKSIDDRWTKKTKHELLASRFETTKRLAKIMGTLEKPPKAFLCASAIGFYGNRGNQWVNEKNHKGRDSFLADVCRAWEDAAGLLKSLGVRVIHLRFGMVLSARKGALKKMLTPFKLGLGGVIGHGDQYMSWIAIDDVVSSIYHAIKHKDLIGPINVVTPHPVTNLEFCTLLAKHLNRSLGPPIPGPLLRLIKGQMADELLLSSTKVEPKKLLESGYRFRYPSLDEAFSHLIY